VAPEFTCRACRRGRCDQCEGGGCACLSCGERTFARGGIIPAGRGGEVPAMLTGCDYVIPQALAAEPRRDGPVAAF
jgi:hypothetical protein